MSTPWVSPGQAAEEAFRTGVRTAALVAFAAVATLYWFGAISLAEAAIVVVAFLPVYLLVVAAALSKWLGFDKDATDLRAASRPRR